MISVPKHLLDIQEPFFVCSKSILKKQVEQIKDLGVNVFYSVKTNFEPAIISELHKQNCSFSVSNPIEFLIATSSGTSPEELIYYERALTKKRIRWLLGAGCTSFVVDTKAAFDNAISELPNGSTLFVRIRANDLPNPYSGTYVPGVDQKTAKQMIKEIKKKGLKSGILHHSSSQVEDPKFWNDKFSIVSSFSEVDVINIGGGFPVSYVGKNYNGLMEQIAGQIKNLEVERIIAEPGRAIVGPACSLVSKVRLIDQNDAVLNCSVYDTHIDTIIADLILPCRSLGSGQKRRYRLLGSSLCNLDVFNSGVELAELKEGDSIIFDKAGAYNVSSAFGSESAIKTYLID